MAYIDFQRFFVRFKIVFYGPGLSGKSSNLQALHELTQEPLELVMLDRDDDVGITCDYMPLKLGQLRGIDTVFKLYSVPGQVRYARARRMVLKDVDGIVFVADSQAAAMDDNRESLAELKRYLKEENIELDDIPLVFQYNKRDLDDVESVDELNRQLNPAEYPWVPAAAVRQENVKECLTMIAKLVFTKAAERYDLIPSRPEDVAASARGSVTGTMSRSEQPAISMAGPSIEVGPLLPPLSDLPEDEIAAAIPSEAHGVQFPITRPPAAMQESTGRQISETVVYLMEERILCRLDDMEAMLQSVFTRVTSLEGEGVATMLSRLEESGFGSGGEGTNPAELTDLQDSIRRLQSTVEAASPGGGSVSDDPMLEVLEQMNGAISQMSRADHSGALEEANSRMEKIETILKEHMVRSQESERRLQDVLAEVGMSSVIPADPAAMAEVPAEMSAGISASLVAIEEKANARGELDIQQAVAALRQQLAESHEHVARASMQPLPPMDDAADIRLEQRQISDTISEIREIVGGVSVELDRVRRTYRSLRQDIQKDIKSQIDEQLATYLADVERPDTGPGPRETGSPGSYSMGPERSK